VLDVTTIPCNFAEAKPPSVAASFDQEIMVVLMAYVSVFKVEIDGLSDVLLARPYSHSLTSVDYFILQISSCKTIFGGSQNTGKKQASGNC
jgi:hypothetical protein